MEIECIPMCLVVCKLKINASYSTTLLVDSNSNLKEKCERLPSRDINMNPALVPSLENAPSK